MRSLILASLLFGGCHFVDDDCDPKARDYHHTEWVCDDQGQCGSLHVCSWSPQYTPRQPIEQITVNGEWLDCYPQPGVWYGTDYEDYGYFCAYHPRRMCYYCPAARSS